MLKTYSNLESSSSRCYVPTLFSNPFSLQCGRDDKVSEGYRLAAELFKDDDVNNRVQTAVNQIVNQMHDRLSPFAVLGSLVDRFVTTPIKELLDKTPPKKEEVDCNSTKINKSLLSKEPEVTECKVLLRDVIARIKACPEGMKLWKSAKMEERSGHFTCEHHCNVEGLFLTRLSSSPYIQLSTKNDVMLRTVIYQLNVIGDYLLSDALETKCRRRNPEFLSRLEYLYERIARQTSTLFDVCNFSREELEKQSLFQKNPVELITEQGQIAYQDAIWHKNCAKKN